MQKRGNNISKCGKHNNEGVRNEPSFKVTAGHSERVSSASPIM